MYYVHFYTMSFLYTFVYSALKPRYVAFLEPFKIIFICKIYPIIIVDMKLFCNVQFVSFVTFVIYMLFFIVYFYFCSVTLTYKFSFCFTGVIMKIRVKQHSVTRQPYNRLYIEEMNSKVHQKMTMTGHMIESSEAQRATKFVFRWTF